MDGPVELDVAMLEQEIREYYWKYLITRDLLELRNIQTVAELVIESFFPADRATADLLRRG